MSIGIYMILNKINDKKYIGSSNNVQSRITQHNWLLRTNKHSNTYLQNSFNLFGEENFDFKLIEICNLNDLVIRENYYIHKYNTMYDKHGFNLCLVSSDRRNIVGNKTKINLSKINLHKNSNFYEFECINILNNEKKIFLSLVDAANFLIENGFTNGKSKHIRQKISYTLRNKKINNGHNGSVRKTAYNHYWNIIN